MDGEAFFARDQARALGDGPALEDTVELEAEIVMQPGGIVLLHAEAEPLPLGGLAFRARASS